MPLSLKTMRYFNTVVAQGSIARAATELNIAASAIAAAVDQVEDTFDLTLVTRQRSRGIEANASGRLIAQKFDRLLEDYEAILNEGAELKETLGGVLRVGYYAPVAPAFLPSILATFLPPGSEATLHLDECDNDQAQTGLLQGDFDVILFVSEGAQAAIQYDVLVEAPAYCLVPADHDFATRPQVSLAVLAREPLIVLDRPVASAYYHKILQDAGAKITVAAYANSTEMVRSLVGQGYGCAVLNMSPLTATTYAGSRVVALPIADRLPPLTLAVAYNRKRPRRVVEHFVRACQTYFSKPGPQRCIVEQVN